MSAGLFHYDSVNLSERITSNIQNNEFKGVSAGGRHGMVAVVTAIYYPLSVLGYDIDFAIRFTGVLMLALSAVALYLLSFEIIRSRMGALAAALLLPSTAFVVISSMIGKEHGLALFFFILACFCALRSHRSKTRILPVAASFFYVASLTVREAWLIATPVFLWFLLLPRIQRVDERLRLRFSQQWKIGLISFVLMFGIALALFLGKNIAAIAGDSATAGVSFTVGYIGLGLAIFRGHTPWMWPFFLFGLYALWRTGRQHIIPLALWLATFFYIVNIAGFSPRYLDVALVPFVIIVGFAIARIARWRLSVGVVCILFLVLTTFWLPLPFLEARHRANNLADFSRYVANVTPPNAFIIALDESAFLRYYGNRNAGGIVLTLDNRLEVVEKIITMQQSGTPVYFLSSVDAYEQTALLPNFLKRNFELEVVGVHLMDNYHSAERGVQIRDVWVIKVKEPLFAWGVTEQSKEEYVLKQWLHDALS